MGTAADGARPNSQASDIMLMVKSAVSKMMVDVVTQMCYLAQSGDISQLRLILADSNINPNEGDYDRRYSTHPPPSSGCRVCCVAPSTGPDCRAAGPLFASPAGAPALHCAYRTGAGLRSRAAW